MRRVDEYTKNATDCRALAAKMPPAVREQLMQMAFQWEQLAEERKRFLALHGETNEPDPTLGPGGGQC